MDNICVEYAHRCARCDEDVPDVAVERARCLAWVRWAESRGLGYPTIRIGIESGAPAPKEDT